MPIDKKRFEEVSDRLEEEILSFLKKHKGKAFTADEIMGATSLYVYLDLPVTSKTSPFMVANFVAVLHDLVSKGKISRKVVDNRMYFTARA
jgi:hypothetical protein